jgi:hypothetical protein
MEGVLVLRLLGVVRLCDGKATIRCVRRDVEESTGRAQDVCLLDCAARVETRSGGGIGVECD